MDLLAPGRLLGFALAHTLNAIKGLLTLARHDIADHPLIPGEFWALGGRRRHVRHERGRSVKFAYEALRIFDIAYEAL
jgi:hypothetical protein